MYRYDYCSKLFHLAYMCLCELGITGEQTQSPESIRLVGYSGYRYHIIQRVVEIKLTFVCGQSHWPGSRVR